MIQNVAKTTEIISPLAALQSSRGATRTRCELSCQKTSLLSKLGFCLPNTCTPKFGSSVPPNLLRAVDLGACNYGPSQLFSSTSRMSIISLESNDTADISVAYDESRLKS
mmetsp:Transcript_36181/g.86220  ORF Transcript_36181/g.86220 Transcript_36181/m.86220 type:complete len:110 (+) Transcript_36181:80-409(+)